MTDVSSISEFELIRRLDFVLAEEMTSISRQQNIVLGIGDDAAIIRPGVESQVITTDTMVDGVHFLMDSINMRNLGWKSLAVNYSDIASMGCTPSHSVITLGLTPTQRVEDLEDMYRGFSDLMKENGGEIVGGDIVRSGTFFISVTVVGESDSQNILRRDSAVPGDLIGITGQLGCSAAGLEALASQDRERNPSNSHFISAHTRPIPRIAQGMTLRETGVSTAMDISDGLLADLGKLCAASDVGADIEIDLIPADSFLKKAYPGRWKELSVTGGEDYELLFTASTEKIGQLTAAGNLDFSVIGTITGSPKTVRVFDGNGKEVIYQSGGWDHFRDPT
ncbi:uncharacterized protein METZ01_LOCUS70324 [marine metagenome]|uniref:PurM-like N-terminal domain-containing protein n=1 Tax=marine metagenome TaxID=408172 RepID=A0A381TN32_9ZZZZ